MAIWQYRCVSCGGVHEVSVRPAGEAMLLRCIVTRQWNWHEPAAFLTPAAEVGVFRAAAAKAPARRSSTRSRPASGRRAAARRRVRTSRAGGSRKRPARKTRTKGRQR
jgi:hypothetical protein